MTSHYIYDTFGKNVPDTNIVIIDIDRSGASELGWPLKRSFYALLFDELDKYSPKVIGFEIFLSDNMPSQEIYNDLLIERLKGKDNLVFSSVMEGFRHDGDFYNADTIKYPFMKRYLPDISTGHTNYIAEDELVIPHIFTTGNTEYPFASMIVEKYSGKLVRNVSLRPKLIADGDDFKSYPFSRFIKQSRNGEIAEYELRDKIVLVGSTSRWGLDRIDYKGVYTQGLYLHANAIDNLLNDRLDPPPLVNNLVNVAFFLLMSFVILRNENSKVGLAFLGIEVLLVVLILLLFNIQISLLVLLMNSTLSAFVFKDGKFHARKAWAKENENKETTGFRQALEKPEQKNEGTKRESENKSEQISLNAKSLTFEGIVYSGKAMAQIVEIIRKAAPETVPVLILGESGSGKELVARALHNQSQRRHGNYIAVNCAALTETLLESELFGHVKGAFTGADKNKQGRFELANNGTIFLDEIGETSDKFQAKLLRVLQSGEYEKVGSGEKFHTNARIIAATNKDLKKLVTQNKFREDLYYRLNVITINIPALSQRREDIPALAKYFLESSAPGFTMNDVFLKHLVSLEWRGNVRELEAAINRAAIFAKFEKRDYLTIADLPEDIASPENDNLDEKIITLLREKKFSHTSIKETAKELGDLNRNLVTENFKGLFFKAYAENNFDLKKAAEVIADTLDVEIIDKVHSKGETYILNVENEVEESGIKSFKNAKEKFSAKYKNLPKQFHPFLDLIIKRVLS